MKLDYKEIGRRIAHRRKQLGLKQATVEEMADIGEKYLSCIERATSTPSTEVLMRLAIALDTTPDEFLVGTVRQQDEAWRDVAELLRPLSDIPLVDYDISWASEHHNGILMSWAFYFGGEEQP